METDKRLPNLNLGGISVFLFLFPDYCSKAIPYAVPHAWTHGAPEFCLAPSATLFRTHAPFTPCHHHPLVSREHRGRQHNAVSRNFLFDDPSSEICSYSMCSGLRASQPKTGMGTCCRHMTVKMLTLEGQERDETRNMAKQTGVHDVILGWSPFIGVPFNPTGKGPGTKSISVLGKGSWYKINFNRLQL